MVFCPYCGQQFTRDEHLERHILTHTNVKPFRCLTCHMSFARRDLLQRHYTVHGRDQNQQEMPAANGMMPKSAGRTPIACVNCAKTKTRCDKKFPCSRCASKNLECTLRSTRRATKNAQRMELPPDGSVAAPPYAGSKETPDAQPAGVANITPPQDRKPSSPEDAAKSNLPWDPQSLSHYEGQDPTAVPSDLAMPTLSINTYQHPAPFGPEDFTPFGNAPDDGTSPHFMIDWQQLQVPMDFNSLNPPSIAMDTAMSADCNTYSFNSGADMMLPMMQDFNGPLLTPIESPQNGHWPELNTQPSRSVSDSSHTSSPPASDTEANAIITAQDSWSAFRCAPTAPAATCPKTALLNLELLEQSLRDHEAWLAWRPRSHESATPPSEDNLTVMQLHESTRDKLLAITQSFLHKALEIHRDCSNRYSTQQGGLPSPRSHSGSNFVLLPPACVLECFLRSYANCFERHFPLSSRGTLDVNDLMHSQNDRAASLLVLMMVAQGATNLPSREARHLNGGLIEACRISLFDLVERNITMSGDPLVLRAALLFTVQAAWSGDKWQMDIAMGQRGMYLAMLRHSGMFDPSVSPRQQQQQQDVSRLWLDWIQDESRSRLVYSWAMADQELALMHDAAASVEVNELVLPMPDADRLWHAQSTRDWSTVFERVHEFAGGRSSVGSGARPCSLLELFTRLLDGDMTSRGRQMTSLHLRLLLLPLQALVRQQAQFMACLPNKSNLRDKQPRDFELEAAQSRMDNIQDLLKQWHDLALQYLQANSPCAVTKSSLVIFHLISLNTVTNFGEIERLARREDFDGSYQQLQWRHSRCIQDSEAALFHCGQVMKDIRTMHQSTRPQWWAGAIYRVALVLWTDSLLIKTGSTQNINGIRPVPGPSLAIDNLPTDHALIARYLIKREGVPCVTKRDGSQMNIDDPFDVLQHCIQLIDEGNSTRFSDGIRSKLDKLSRQ